MKGTYFQAYSKSFSFQTYHFPNLKSSSFQIYLNSKILGVNIDNRLVIPGGDMTFQDFGRSANPISTRRARLYPPHHYQHPRIFTHSYVHVKILSISAFILFLIPTNLRGTEVQIECGEARALSHGIQQISKYCSNQGRIVPLTLLSAP